MNKYIKLPFCRLVLKSNSQLYEDIILDNMLKSKKNGVYIDVGANDPKSWSNTKFFYERGWTGVNIEPNPDLFDKFKKYRSHDINLNIGIGAKKETLPFYQMSDDKISTFDKDEIPEFEKLGHRVVSTIQVPVITLKEVFETYYPDRIVDFISVDVEGFDMEVLQSNDWTKYRPTFIVLEVLRDKDSFLKYMKSIGYSLIYINFTNGIFLDEEANYHLPPHKWIHKFIGIA